MPLTHLALALLVVSIWGTNFVVIKWGLASWPPIFFVALRFALSSLPMLVLARPAPWRALLPYGLFIGVGQFGLLFYAMQADITPGLASLLVQTQVFFTIAMAAAMMGERLRGWQWVGLALAVAGMAVIAWHRSRGDGAAGTLAVTLTGVLLVLAAAFSWACGNLAIKRAGKVDMLQFVVWSSAAAVPALLALSLLTEGWGAIRGALLGADARAWAAVGWQALGNTLVGYSIWNWLLARHPAGVVTPLALGVPIFGMAASSWALGESMPPWKLVAAALVLSGLALNIWQGRRR